MGMELFGYSFVIFGFLRLDDPEMLTIAINDIVLYAIYFIIIGESTLRFSPRFTLGTGIACTLIFTILGFLIKARGGDKSVFPVTTLTIVLGALFIFAMTIASYSGTRFVRKIVTEFKDSEETALKKSSELSNLIDQTKFTIDELDTIIGNINEIAESSLELSSKQLTYTESSKGIITHFSDSIGRIAQMAKTQEDNCQENKHSIDSLSEVTGRVDSASKKIIDEGERAKKLTTKGEDELNQSIMEIQNISNSSR